MRSATRLLVLLLAWALVPGAAEVVENVWHQVSRGHSAHATLAGTDHAPEGDEHGCSATFHLCPCHHSLAGSRSDAAAGSLLDSGGRRGPAQRLAVILDPILPLPEHPPRA